MIAESIELLVDPIFAVDDQSLMLRDVVCLAKVLEDRGVSRLETVGERLVGDVLVMPILTGEQIQGPLAMTGVDALFSLDLDVAEERAVVLVKLVIDEGTIGFLRRDNRFQAAHTAAKAHENDVGTFVVCAVDIFLGLRRSRRWWDCSAWFDLVVTSQDQAG